MTRASAIAAHQSNQRRLVEQLKKLLPDRVPPEQVQTMPVHQPGRRTKQRAVAWYGGRGVAWDGLETAYVYSVGRQYAPGARGYVYHASATQSGLALPVKPS